jgi:hypothetical protein
MCAETRKLIQKHFQYSRDTQLRSNRTIGQLRAGACLRVGVAQTRTVSRARCPIRRGRGVVSGGRRSWINVKNSASEDEFTTYWVALAQSPYHYCLCPRAAGTPGRSLRAPGAPRCGASVPLSPPSRQLRRVRCHGHSLRLLCTATLHSGAQMKVIQRIRAMHDLEDAPV